MSWDLGWGNSVAVREAFLANYLGNPIQFAREDLLKFDYPSHEGDPKLVEITKKVIERQTGLSYKHVFLTNGATGGVVIALRAYATQGYQYCHTRNAPYYVRYPRMIQASGLMQVDQQHWQMPNESVLLLDLPSNPQGMLNHIAHSDLNPVPTVIDGVYLNHVYMRVMPKTLPVHQIMVGSYSKLIGINGIRVGWIATNDDLLAPRLAELVASEYCGLSTASTDILKGLLFGLDWKKFEESARDKLDINRENFTQLERFFSGAPVPSIGMFYYGPMDKKAQEIFTKAKVSWTKGSAMGTNDDYARFNLGQNNEYTENAITAILKADRIK